MSEIATMAKQETNKKTGPGRPRNPDPQESVKLQIYLLPRQIRYLETLKVNEFGDVASIANVVRNIIDDHIRASQKQS